MGGPSVVRGHCPQEESLGTVTAGAGSGSSDSSQSALHSIVVVFVRILFLESEILPLRLIFLERSSLNQ